MHRQLLRQEPEVIAVVAKHEGIFKRWQKENDFHDLPGIKWRYIRGKYSIIGIKFTMLWLIGDWYRRDNAGRLTTLIAENIGSAVRTFGTEEEWKDGYKYRQTATGGNLPYHLL